MMFFDWLRNKWGGNLRLLTIGNSEFANPSANLPGCKIDAQRMARAYALRGAKVMEKHNQTAQQMRDEFLAALEWVEKGRTLVHHVSSHGSQVGDRNGDEADRLDEVTCGADLNVTPDDWYADAIMQRLAAKGGNVILILDTCKSGGMARAVQDHPEKPRFWHQSLLAPGALFGWSQLRRRYHYPRAAMIWSVWAGCAENAYCYDSSNGGKFTNAVLASISACGNCGVGKLNAYIINHGILPTASAPQVPCVFGKLDIPIFG